MMDHYEELGLDRLASPEEIRQAYKRLVRLLHPDRCSDEPVRQLAELQMKRLNGVLSLLTNPAERANYDRSLALGTAPWRLPRLPAWGRPMGTPRWFWPAAAGVALLSLATLLLHIPHSPPPKGMESPVAVTPATTESPVRGGRPQRSRSRTATATSKSQGSAPSLGPPPEFRRPAVSQPETAAVPTGESSRPPVEIAIRAVPQVESPPTVRPTLSGEWLFVPSSHTKKAGLYPPEYIELRVTEESGILHGRYRARYRITDRAISPMVSFQFEGRSEADGTSLPWSGIGGAQGEVSLRLLNSGALEVNWVATQMGGELELISGTATLVRRLD